MSEQPLTVLGYMDVVLVVLAAPIMLLIGVPADGYCIAGGTWIALRALGVAVERFAAATPEANRQIGVRMGYMLGRLFTLAIVVILVRKSDGQDAGLAALAVVVFAFTAQLVLSAFTRPRPSSKRRPPAAPRTRSR
ncbi:MAG TPA: hypothetical protein VHW04_21700 [Solirubrobacteraceae bacterium]|jgi:hypothetical protein|nr:hypothetical protein [Solirubrobacteraceae bacterium]